MPRIGYRAFYRAAKDNGHSESQSRRIARRIMARPDLDFITEQLTQRGWLPHHDPTADEAIWNVLTEILTTNTAMETAS